LTGGGGFANLSLMPRPLRPIDDGLIYHVISRGNNRQDVFHKPADFQAFLAALAELKERKPFELYGYCLLNNHFHLLLRPTGAPSAGSSISRIMQSLLVSHTQRYHRHYQSGGHVWQGRFKSPVIQHDEHLLTVLRYIEANPLRAKIVTRADEYPWSSYPVHGLGTTDELVDSLVNYDELSPLAKVRQRKWAQKVHQPIEEAHLDAIRRSSASGLPYGDKAWVKRLAKRLELDLVIRPRGRPRKASASPGSPISK
jgi:putative transposase